MGYGLYTGGITFFVYGTSIVIEMIVLSMFLVGFHRPSDSLVKYEPFNVFTATVFLGLFYMIFIFILGWEYGEFHQDPFSESAFIVVLSQYKIDLVLVSVSLFISNGVSFFFMDRKLRPLKTESDLIHKTLILSGIGVFGFIMASIFGVEARQTIVASLVLPRFSLAFVDFIKV